GVAGEGPIEPAAALPAAAQGVWLAADTDPANSAVVVQLGTDGASVPFGSFDAAFANPRADFSLAGCAQYAASTTAGRAFVKASGGTGIVATGWCVTSGAWWWQPVGAGATTNVFRGASILDVHPFAGGGGLAIRADGSRDAMQSNGSEASVGGTPASLVWGAVSPGATDENAPLYGYVGGTGIVVSRGVFQPYVTLVLPAPPLLKLSAIPHFVLGLAASSLVALNTDSITLATLALPGNGTGADFASAVDANGKLRVAVRLADGSVWVYDQP
ncbi:hypothetical protein, partial [Cupriavidus sp. WS]|uniref:hypothetical protein n=1 Tax=Cupriavidus sp. WS TaxID=1312922 RepID=UPI001E2A244A